ncbi:glycerol-3-phosphate acyltransferase PlsX [Methylacidimicrobium cyclopophantes]|uniref:Phosphate acyltransferase n=1 Tax=Methylacidimicrobium cyclopophantes TaxID=1041766 RepID=A0A5E6M7W8_9BACT|nr:phosphate acyltransferase PlsX [Methylacidimicrobium cyclopophantes]VVM05453.1 glycerol-3-phosphate acyltransferase PlsX [Methylacidimicrobium cyclopophantes]
MKIALDVMGGDFAPRNPLLGAVGALQSYPDLFLFLVGDQERIAEEFWRHGGRAFGDRVEFVHASQVVPMDAQAIESVRQKRDSSISRCVRLVKEGKADALVSAGHTGAVVAASTILLRTLPGISRAGIATTIPTEQKPFLLIDSGANIDSDPVHLLGYAIMGSIYSREVLHVPNPRVGLLSIGTEDVKGNELTKQAFKLLAQAKINFGGNVEGHDLFEKPVDVVVCDGFVGNVVLKTAESVAKAVMHWLRSELTQNPLRMFGAYLARGAFLSVKQKASYEEYGGALLLGVNGTCIIAHGASTPKAICNAIRIAREAVTQNVNSRIIQEMRRHCEAESENTAASRA